MGLSGDAMGCGAMGAMGMRWEGEGRGWDGVLNGVLDGVLDWSAGWGVGLDVGCCIGIWIGIWIGCWIGGCWTPSTAWSECPCGKHAATARRWIDSAWLPQLAKLPTSGCCSTRHRRRWWCRLAAARWTARWAGPPGMGWGDCCCVSPHLAACRSLHRSLVAHPYASQRGRRLVASCSPPLDSSRSHWRRRQHRPLRCRSQKGQTRGETE